MQVAELGNGNASTMGARVHRQCGEGDAPNETCGQFLWDTADKIGTANNEQSESKTGRPMRCKRSNAGIDNCSSERLKMMSETNCDCV